MSGLRPRLRVLPRGPWWVEGACAIGGYELYNVVQAQTAGEADDADQHARSILHAESLLHLDPEHALNHFTTAHIWLSLATGYWYALAHVAVTATVLGFLWWRRPDSYARMRTALLGASLLALLVFWLYPVAPPRLAVSGLTDIVMRHNILGARHVTSGHLVNLYAAMPSLHVAWAVWCAAAVALTGIGSRWRHLAWLYPLAMTFVILGTANHFVLDAIAGAALMAVVLVLSGARTPPVPGELVLPDAREPITVPSPSRTKVAL